MAQLLIIKDETVRDGMQYIGDMVGVFEDSHVFSDNELVLFDVLIVNGSRADVEARVNQLRPLEDNAAIWDTDGKYHFMSGIPPEGTVLSDPIQVFNVGNKWYQKVVGFKFLINVDGLTPQEKELLETIDINNPAIDSFINKIVKDLASQVGNDIEIIDLRNLTP